MQRADGRVFTGRAGGPRLLQEGVQLDETRRDETRGTAQHRTGTKRRANTGLSGVLNISTRQGMHHRRTGQGFTHPSTASITHTIRPVSTEKHLRIPSQRYARRNTLLGREKCHLANLRHYPILRPPGNQIKSNLARLLRQARQTSSCSCAHASTPPRDGLTRLASIQYLNTYIHIYITRGYMQYI